MLSTRVLLAAAVAAILALLAVAALRTTRSTVPRGLPPLAIPADNPMSAAKVALGRSLFYDRRLSFNESTACADCHRQEHAFTDPRPQSVGATGERTPRNAMTLANVAYNARYTWANDSLKTLEQQALVPLTGEHPLEMGVQRDEAGILQRFRSDPEASARFRAAFPGENDPIRLDNVVRAISSFERTLISYDAPFDRSLVGDTRALSDSARRGFALFRSARLKCQRCHDGFNFRTTPGHRSGEGDDSVAYHNTGLYNVDGNGAYPATDRGLIDVTGDPAHMGRFKAPTLRNVEVTAPYMHDGSIASLEGVIEHYARGGRLVASGPNAGDGRASPLKSPLVSGFEITMEEKRDLVEFLRSLTDQGFLTRPALSNPGRP